MRRNTHADQDPFLPFCLGDIDGSRLHRWLLAPLNGAHLRRDAVLSLCPLIRTHATKIVRPGTSPKRRIFAVAYGC